MARLYDLSAEYIGWMDALESDDEDERRLAEDTLPMLKDEIQFKAENYAKAIKCLEADAVAYGNEADRLDAKRKSAENAVKRLKAELADAMTVAGIDKLPTSIGKWSIRVCPPSIDIVDESQIPEQYLEPQPPKILKSAILKAYKESGELVNGTTVVTDKKTISFR